MNDNSPTGPKVKEYVDLEMLLTRAQNKLRSVEPPPPPTRVIRDPILWQGVALGGLVAGIGALIVMILMRLLS